MTSIFATGIASTVVPFGGTAVAAGAVLVGLLLATATILIVADRMAAS
jgi:hypothetical protein